MRYKFTFRRNLLWKSIEVAGHNYNPDQDKMILIMKDGGLMEIKHWKDCEVKLGADWFAETKRAMEEKAGQVIPTKMEGK